ncbi:hypothetical protein BFW86_08835 [Pseudomonas fluorescens]|nr:hypothetical protein BFW86_08835 [Pseudomonas fluorescens]
MGFCFGRSESSPKAITLLNEKITLQTAVGEIHAKCFRIFGMVQHIFARNDLSSAGRGVAFLNEML